MTELQKYKICKIKGSPTQPHPPPKKFKQPNTINSRTLTPVNGKRPGS